MIECNAYCVLDQYHDANNMVVSLTRWHTQQMGSKLQLHAEIQAVIMNVLGLRQKHALTQSQQPWPLPCLVSSDRA